MLPDYEPMALLPEGKYVFEIINVTKKKSEKNENVTLIFIELMADNGEIKRKIKELFIPWKERYGDLVLALGGKEKEGGGYSLSDIDVIGKKFTADIEHVPDFKDPNIKRTRIERIQHSSPQTTKADTEDDDVPF
jgi:hypothetical protein